MDRFEPGDVAHLTANFTTVPTEGTIARTSNQLTVDSPTGYSTSDAVLVEGAGPNGADLVTTISTIAGSVFTLAANADTAVTAATVGKLTDVAPVTCTISLPTGGQATPSVVHDATGRYHADYTTTVAGVHRYEFISPNGVIVGSFEVQPVGYASLSPRALCTVDELNQLLGNIAPGTDDATRTRLVNDASAQIIREAGREFVARNAVRDPTTGLVTVAPQTRTFVIDRELVWWRDLYVGDLAATAWTYPSSGALTVTMRPYASTTPTSLVVTDLTYVPDSRDPWEPIRRIRFPRSVGLFAGQLLAVTAVWGFPSVPDDIHQATIKLAAGNYLRDARRSSQQADETGQYLPGTMIGSALATARAYRIDTPVATAV